MVGRVSLWLRTTGRLGLALGACTFACGCISDREIAERSMIEPGSPVAMAIASAKSQPPAYPKFSDVPAVPTDLRSAAAWRQLAGNLDAARQGLDRTIAANPPLSSDTEGFLRDALARTAGAAPVEDSTAASEAFRRQGIERATPPPLPR